MAALPARTPAASGRRLASVAVVEDHPLVLSALLALLDNQPALRVIATARTVGELLSSHQGWQADLILLDIDLPDGSGLDAARKVMDTDDQVGVVFYSASTDPDIIHQALETGCRGYISKLADESQIVPLLLDAAAGKRVFDSNTASVALSRRPVDDAPSLTPREAQVLTLIATDKTNARIAVELGISENTVKTLVGRALGKLHVSTRAAGVAVAVGSGLIRPPQ